MGISNRELKNLQVALRDGEADLLERVMGFILAHDASELAELRDDLNDFLMNEGVDLVQHVDSLDLESKRSLQRSLADENAALRIAATGAIVFSRDALSRSEQPGDESRRLVLAMMSDAMLFIRKLMRGEGRGTLRDLMVNSDAIQSEDFQQWIDARQQQFAKPAVGVRDDEIPDAFLDLFS